MLEQLIDTTTIIGPDVYYALLMLGFWALITAIYQPGTGLPEGTAAIALTLSLSGLLFLPATLIGLVLLGASLLTFLALIFYRQRVWLVAVGFALSVAGGVLLFGPGMRVSVWSVGLVTILGILYHQLLLVPGLRIQERAGQVGGETLIGEEARVVSALEPDGTVRLHGETWRASSEEPIKAGERVVVTDLHDLRLTVARASGDHHHEPRG